MREVLPAPDVGVRARRGGRDGDRCPDMALGAAARRGLDARDRGRRGGRLGERRLRGGRALRRLGAEVLGDGAIAGTRKAYVSPTRRVALGLTCGGVLEVFLERVSPGPAPAAGIAGERRGRGAGRRSPPWSRVRTTSAATSVMYVLTAWRALSVRRAIDGRSVRMSWACWSPARRFLHFGPDARARHRAGRGVRRLVRARAAHGHLRGHRLLRRAREGGQAARVPRHRRRRS